jgi:hypothetical protein
MWWLHSMVLWKMVLLVLQNLPTKVKSSQTRLTVRSIRYSSRYIIRIPRCEVIHRHFQMCKLAFATVTHVALNTEPQRPLATTASTVITQDCPRLGSLEREGRFQICTFPCRLLVKIIFFVIWRAF